MIVRDDDLSGAQTLNLLRIHLTGMHANSPPGQVFALDLSGLRHPAVTTWSVWDDERICGLGALKRLDGQHGEIKSMRTHPDHLRKGVARLLLDHMVGKARARGLTLLSLETGSGPAFDPAIALYKNYGFVSGGPFADYGQSDFNQFMHLSL